MKKLLALLLAMIMLFSLAACGGGSSDDEDEEEHTRKPKTTEDEPEVEGTSLETNLWTLVYDDQLWQFDEEEDLYDEENWCSINLMVPDEEDEDSYVTYVEISASIEDAENFRDMLINNGFDQYEYAEEDAYSTVDVGGVDCLEYETESWGEDIVRWFGRVEEAGLTVTVEVTGAYEEYVDDLLDGLSFNVEDTGNQDVPWYWEGTPISAQNTTEFVGSKSIASTWIPFEEAVVTNETFNHSVAVAGDKAYIISDGVLNIYDFDGESLVYSETLELDGEYEYAYADQNGTVWLSAFMEDLVCYSGTEQVADYGELDCVAVAPNGQWGVSWFSGPECQLLTFSSGSVSTSDITFDEVESIPHLNVDNDHIYVCGSGSDNEHRVYVYDTDGNLELTLSGEDGEGLGSVTFVAQISGGFIGLDGNMRDIVVWDENGNWLGSTEDGDLFGTSYPWFCGGALLSDGSILVIMTEDRSDESAMELIAFKLTVS